MMGYTFGMGGIFMGLVMIIFWVGVISLIVWLFMSLFQKSQQTETDSPLEILRSRYAKGEITKQQFENMKKDVIKT